VTGEAWWAPLEKIVVDSGIVIDAVARRSGSHRVLIWSQANADLDNRLQVRTPDGHRMAALPLMPRDELHQGGVNRRRCLATGVPARDSGS